MGVYSISVLGEENSVFLKSGSPDQFETPAFGLEELWPGSGSLSPRLTAARVPGSVLGISALQFPVSGWENSTLPPLPAGSQLQHFACCLQLCRYCFQKGLLGEILNSRSAWEVNFKENTFQQITLWGQLWGTYRDSQGFKAGVIKACIFLAAVSTPTADFCCTGTAWEVQREGAQGAAPIRAISASLHSGCTRGCGSPAAGRGGRGDRVKAGPAAPSGGGPRGTGV